MFHVGSGGRVSSGMRENSEHFAQSIRLCLMEKIWDFTRRFNFVPNAWSSKLLISELLVWWRSLLQNLTISFVTQIFFSVFITLPRRLHLSSQVFVRIGMSAIERLWLKYFSTCCVMKLLSVKKQINLCVRRHKFYPQIAEQWKWKKGFPLHDYEVALASFPNIYVKSMVLGNFRPNWGQ